MKTIYYVNEQKRQLFIEYQEQTLLQVLSFYKYDSDNSKIKQKIKLSAIQFSQY